MAADQEFIAGELTAAITAVNAAISTVGTLQGAGIRVLASVSAAVDDGLAAFVSGINALDNDINLVDAGGVAAGMTATAMAAALTTQTSEMQQLATLVVAKAYFARVGINVRQAPG